MPSLSTQILSQVLKITGQAYNTPVIVEIPHAFFLIPPVSFLFLYLLIPCFVLFFSPFFPLVVQYRVYIYNKTTMFSHFLLKTKEAALICSGRLPCSIGHFLIKAPGIIQHGGNSPKRRPLYWVHRYVYIVVLFHLVFLVLRHSMAFHVSTSTLHFSKHSTNSKKHTCKPF